MACSGLDGDLVDDPTPQLGEDLDTNAHNIKFDDVKGILDDSGNEQSMKLSAFFAFLSSYSNF